MEKFKFTEYPREQKGSYERKPLKPSEFEAKRAKVNDTQLTPRTTRPLDLTAPLFPLQVNETLREAGHATVIVEEQVAARMP